MTAAISKNATAQVDLPVKSKKDEYFTQAIDWDEQRRLSIVKRAIRNQRLAWANGLLAAVAILTIPVLLPLKTFIPVVIRVNEMTGAYDVDVNWRKVDLLDPKWEKTKIMDLTRYINSREGYSRGEAEKNYQTVYLMSCGSVRAEWDQYYKPENNPNSPLLTLTPSDTDNVKITNVTFLPTDREDIQTAQIRFEKIISRGSAAPVLSKYISTIEFKYDKANAPSEIPSMQFNAFGMCVNRYHRDQEGESRQLTVNQAAASPDAIPAAFAAPPAPAAPAAPAAPVVQPGAYSGTVTPENIGTNPVTAQQGVRQ